MKTPFPPQQRLIDMSYESLRANGAFCNTSDTGTGKTLMSLRAAKALGQEPLVVCPKAVIPGWIRAAKEQGVVLHDVVSYQFLTRGKSKYGTFSPGTRETPETFGWRMRNRMVIFDEVHRCQTSGSKSSQLLVATKHQGLPALSLSATAFEDPSEMKSIGFSLGLHKLTNYVTWALDHGCEFDLRGKLVFPLEAEQSERQEECLKRIRDAIYATGKAWKLTRDDLPELFQETTILDTPMDFGDNAAIQAAYQEMGDEVAEIEALLKGDLARAKARAAWMGQDPEQAEVSILTRLLRARQKVEALKVPTMLEMIEQDRREKFSVAVFVNFNATIEALLERIKEPVSVFRGEDSGQSTKERQIAWANFQRNATKIIIVNSAAGGAGLELHDEYGGHPRTSIISPDFDAKKGHQVLGRIDRAGSKTPSLQRILIAADTIEEKVMESVRAKLRNMRVLHDTEKLRKKLLTDSVPSHTLNTQLDLPMPQVLECTEENPTGVLVEVPEPVVEAAAPIAEPAHAEFGPSTLKYFEIAPMYRPRHDDTNEAAEKGTRIHLACETGNLDALVDEERLIAEQMLAAVDMIKARHKVPADVEDHKEIRLYMKTPSGIETFGTCDRLFINKNEGVMIDYKTGRNSIDDPEVNAQTQAYVAGAFQKFPELQVIHFYFIVPVRDEVLFATYKRAQLPDLLLRITAIIARAKAATTCNPQPGVCDFCARLHDADCKHIENKALVLARKYQFDGYVVPDQVHSSEVTDGKTMGELLRLSRLMKDWSEAVAYRAKQTAFEEGQEIDGFTKLKVGGKTSVLSTLGAFNALKDKMSPEDFMSCCTLDMGKAEKFFSDNAARGGKTAAIEAMKDTLTDAGLLVQGEGSFQLRVKRK